VSLQNLDVDFRAPRFPKPTPPARCTPAAQNTHTRHRSIDRTNFFEFRPSLLRDGAGRREADLRIRGCARLALYAVQFVEELASFENVGRVFGFVGILSCLSKESPLALAKVSESNP